MGQVYTRVAFGLLEGIFVSVAFTHTHLHAISGLSQDDNGSWTKSAVSPPLPGTFILIAPNASDSRAKSSGMSMITNLRPHNDQFRTYCDLAALKYL